MRPVTASHLHYETAPKTELIFSIRSRTESLNSIDLFTYSPVAQFLATDSFRKIDHQELNGVAELYVDDYLRSSLEFNYSFEKQRMSCNNR